MFDSNTSETALFAAPKAYNPLEANHLIPNHSHPSSLDVIFNSSPQLSLSLGSRFEQDYFESTLASSISLSDSQTEEEFITTVDDDPLTGISVNQPHKMLATGGYDVNSENEFAESNENNNISYQGITITGSQTPQPDLVITNISIPNSLVAGKSLFFNYTITNQGNAATGLLGWSDTKFYLSNDTLLDRSDIYLENDLAWSLSAGESDTESVYTRLDPTLEGGKYYLLAQADGNQKISESNEANNIAYQEITITEALLPDLAITNIVTPNSVTAGYGIDLTYTLTNQGNKSTGYLGSSVKFYFSIDTILDDSDTYLTNGSYSALSAGQSTTESLSAYLDFNLKAGTYYIFAQADSYDFLTEKNESNNIAYTAIQVFASSNGYSGVSGYGLVNAAEAVAKALEQESFADVPNLGGNNWGADLVNAPEVWAQGFTGEDIVVAVLDTGIERNHPDLIDNIWMNSEEIADDGIDNDGNGYIDDVYGWNFIGSFGGFSSFFDTEGNNDTLDHRGHGTHVAGTIAGMKNDFGVTGIAYDAKIMRLKS